MAGSERIKKALIGRFAVRAGLITQEQLLECLEEQQVYLEEGKEVPRLGELLVQKGYITPEQLEELARTVEGKEYAAPEETPPYEQEGEFAGYEIMERLGVDAYGILYKARNKKNDMVVVLKVIHKNVLDGSPEFKERFVEETRKCVSLEHPGIRRVHSVGTSKGRLYYTAAYVEGKSLRQKVNEEGPLDVSTAMKVSIALAETLWYGHQRGFVHGDFRPSNVIVTPGEEIVVCEFGVLKDTLGNLNRLLETTDDVGCYIAPEQVVADRPPDERVDIYALGAVMYFILTGHPPFEGRSALASLAKRAYESPIPPADVNPVVPEDLSRIVMKMLQPEPSARYQTMMEVIQALKEVSSRPAAARTAVRRRKQPPQTDFVDDDDEEEEELRRARRRERTTVRRIRPRSRTNPAVAMLALMIIVGGLIGVAYIVTHAPKESKNTPTTPKPPVTVEPAGEVTPPVTGDKAGKDAEKGEKKEEKKKPEARAKTASEKVREAMMKRKKEAEGTKTKSEKKQVSPNRIQLGTGGSLFAPPGWKEGKPLPVPPEAQAKEEEKKKEEQK